MRYIHLDTDIGSDTDDLCALAMLLKSPEVEIVGITTCAEIGGFRAGFVDYVLRKVDRLEIPVAAGAEGSLGGFRSPVGLSEPHRYWPGGVIPRPAPAGAALDLLERSIEKGATIIGIGPFTNLAMLEAARPGALEGAGVVLMGGFVTPPREGLPAWGREMDYNVQQDRLAAEIVFERCQPTLVQLPLTMEVWLQKRHLPALRQAGPLGELIALQSELHCKGFGMSQLARQSVGLPADLLNFQHDALTCAVAMGWDGVKIEMIRLQPGVDDAGFLHFRVHAGGKLARVVTGVDGERFSREWLATVGQVPPLGLGSDVEGHTDDHRRDSRQALR